MLLLDRLAVAIRDPVILNLLCHSTRRTAERGGSFWEYARGISLGCPLSPLIGAFFLEELDRRMSATGLFYIRFMDDILVLAPTRWKLRRAVRAVNQALGALRLEKHPDKTVIGRIARGFDCLGYYFTAERTVQTAQRVRRAAGPRPAPAARVSDTTDARRRGIAAPPSHAPRARPCTPRARGRHHRSV